MLADAFPNAVCWKAYASRILFLWLMKKYKKSTGEIISDWFKGEKVNKTLFIFFVYSLDAK
jgi:hypothetical protein